MRPQHRRVRLTALGVLAVVCACANPYHASQLRVPEAEFRQRVKTISLASVDLSNKLPQHDTAAASIEALLTEILHRSGFTVLSSKFYADAWRRNVQKVGGYYDSMSGERDPVKYKRVVEDTLHEVLTQQHPDVILYPSVEVVDVKFVDGIARWNGVEEPLGGFWGSDLSGSVGALSLDVVMQDAKGAELYAGSGGIQLLAKIAGGRFVPYISESLLGDREQLTRAVFIVLGELLGPPSAAVRDCIAHSAVELFVHHSGLGQQAPVEIPDDFLKSARGQHLRVQCEMRMRKASAGTAASLPPP